VAADGGGAAGDGAAAIDGAGVDGAGPRVAYQGERGAFSEEAVLAYFASPVALAVPSWRSVFESIADGSVDSGVVAIENSLGGSIRETYDLLYEFGLSITGEVTVPVRLALMALPGQTLDDIERVYSHPQGIAQADEFLRTRPWQVMTAYNTAGSAKMIRDRDERGAAAVASARVAAIYGLEILARDVQSGEENHTRFAVLSRTGDLPATWVRQLPVRPPKTTLVFATRNVPGSLWRCLGCFAERGINLSSLESRPSRAARWEYVFWADLDAAVDEPALIAAFEALREHAAMVRVLGSYPRAADP
jgi:prephenate dehydratase